MLTRSRPDTEGGAILVLTALLLVVLMGFAAIAVDAAAAWSNRREAQTAADLASLAAVQEIPRTLTAEMDTEVAATGAEFVGLNAPRAVASVGTATAGPSCDARPPGFDAPVLHERRGRCPERLGQLLRPRRRSRRRLRRVRRCRGADRRRVPDDEALPDRGSRWRRSAPALRHPCRQLSRAHPPAVPPPADPAAAGAPVPIGSTDLQLLGVRRFDLGCGGLDTDFVATTNANLTLGVDHLVDPDLTAPAMLELPRAVNRVTSSRSPTP